jgi:hypothetical protein
VRVYKLLHQLPFNVSLQTLRDVDALVVVSEYCSRHGLSGLLVLLEFLLEGVALVVMC